MSTVKKDITHKRFATLAKMGERVFHTADLENIWGITDVNTLHTTLSRYVRAGLLWRIYRGLYTLDDPAKIDPLVLGVKALHRPCYVTNETVLAGEGIITQRLDAITLVSDMSSQFVVAGRRYRSRQLADELLYNDAGIVERADGVRVASIERAIVDMLYFAPTYHFDTLSGADLSRVHAINAAMGLPPITRKL